MREEIVQKVMVTVVIYTLSVSIYGSYRIKGEIPVALIYIIKMLESLLHMEGLRSFTNERFCSISNLFRKFFLMFPLKVVRIVLQYGIFRFIADHEIAIISNHFTCKPFFHCDLLSWIRWTKQEFPFPTYDINYTGGMSKT